MENIASTVGSIAQYRLVSVERSCSAHPREWIVMATNPKQDERNFILERSEVLSFCTGFVECQVQALQQQN
jgi:hypothetical protein